MEDPEKGRWLNMAEMSSPRGLWGESGAQSRVWFFSSLRSLISYVFRLHPGESEAS